MYVRVNSDVSRHSFLSRHSELIGNYDTRQLAAPIENANTNYKVIKRVESIGVYDITSRLNLILSVSRFLSYELYSCDKTSYRTRRLPYICCSCNLYTAII